MEFSKICYISFCNLNTLKNKILIIENDEDIRSVVSFILEAEGYNVTGAAYALESLSILKPDLLLLDEWVNNVAGHMLCKEIKAFKAFLHVPVIIFSTALDLKEIATACEADGYLPKPFDIDVLISEVKRLLPLAALTEL